MKKRSRARKIVLDVLYRLEIEGCSLEDAMADYREELETLGVLDFAERETHGVVEHMDDLDAVIERYAEGWPLNRMPILDRNILRIGLFEILYLDDVPDSVTINEAVEMANTYSTEESGKFVNGILGRVVKEQDAKKVGG